MKSLFLVRHAKSSWDFPDLSDFDRPLNYRGERDAPRIGRYLKDENIQPELLLSSPANRALTTARIIARSIDHDKEISTDRRIYHAGEDQLLRIIQEQEDHLGSVMIFGHNPGFTDFANALSNESIDNIPTCGICQIDFQVDRWSDVRFGRGDMIFFQFPKGL